MKKNDLKYLINSILFIDVCCIAVMGLLLAFVIPSGGRAAKRFLGLSRHTWGDVHLSFSLVLLVLLALHLWLNRTWIVQSTKRYFGDYWQQVLWGFCGAWVVVLLLAMIAAH